MTLYLIKAQRQTIVQYQRLVRQQTGQCLQVAGTLQELTNLKLALRQIQGRCSRKEAEINNTLGITPEAKAKQLRQIAKKFSQQLREKRRRIAEVDDKIVPLAYGIESGDGLE